MSTDLKIPTSLGQMLEWRDELLKLMGAHADVVDKITALISQAEIVWSWRCNEYDPRGKIVHQMHEMDSAFWRAAFERIGITKVMSQKKRDEFLKGVDEKHTPFNTDNIIGLRQNADRIFRENSVGIVKEIYTTLIGCEYGDWKSKKKDNLQKIEKVFRTRGSDIRWLSWPMTPRFEYEPDLRNGNGLHFNDLFNACFLLEGLGVPDYHNNFYSIAQPQLKGGTGKVVTDYFTVQAYKNGNVKVSWNENKIDVLARLNAFGAGDENALPDTMRKRYKPEHFKDRPEDLEEILAHGDAVHNHKTDFDFFFTPEAVALHMIQVADIRNGMKVLEPSAGEGHIASFFPFGEHLDVYVVEITQSRFKKLERLFEYQKPYQWNYVMLINKDFLSESIKKNLEPESFDRVVMNPPFTNDMQHVIEAMKYLKPSGRLVTILPEGWFFRKDKRAVAFRKYMEIHAGRSIELDAGIFAEAGTKIKARIVILEKETYPETML